MTVTVINFPELGIEVDLDHLQNVLEGMADGDCFVFDHEIERALLHYEAAQKQPSGACDPGKHFERFRDWVKNQVEAKQARE